MADSITISEFPVEYLTALDEVLALESFSSKYDVDGAEFVSNKTVKVPSIAFDGGLNDYDGFATENEATLSFDTYTLANDKQAVFKVDAVNDNDTANVLSTNLYSEFLRTKAVPEMDADFFATAADNAGTTVDDVTLTTSNIKSEIRKIRSAFKNAGIVGGDLYMSSEALALLEDAIDRQFAGEGTITDAVGNYNGFNIYEVPEERLGEGVQIIAIAPKCFRYIKKRAVTYMFAPGTHTNGDCWLSQSRWVYGGVAYKNKTVGLYVVVNPQ